MGHAILRAMVGSLPMVDIPTVFFIYSNYHFLIKCLGEIFRRKKVEERLKKISDKKIEREIF